MLNLNVKIFLLAHQTAAVVSMASSVSQSMSSENSCSSNGKRSKPMSTKNAKVHVMFFDVQMLVNNGRDAGETEAEQCMGCVATRTCLFTLPTARNNHAIKIYHYVYFLFEYTHTHAVESVRCFRKRAYFDAPTFGGHSET
jgi:hypothetical protein